MGGVGDHCGRAWLAAGVDRAARVPWETTKTAHEAVFFDADRDLDERARRMGNVRTLLLLVNLSGLAGCVVCPDRPPGAPVVAACQFTPEQEELHQQVVRERQQRLYEEWDRGGGM